MRCDGHRGAGKAPRLALRWGWRVSLDLKKIMVQGRDEAATALSIYAVVVRARREKDHRVEDE
jgi:hypothetical protein